MRAQTVNFERGKDPRSSMDIGLVKSMRQKFEDLKNDYRIRETWMDHWQGKDCLSVSYDIIHGWNPAYEAVKENLGMEWFEPGKGKDSHLSGVRNFFVKPEYLYLFAPNANESMNFQKGLNPKRALDIGIVRSITSDDLSLLGFGWLYNEQRFDEEEFKREYNFAGDTPEEKSETLDRAKTVAKALEDQIVMHYPFYDWKEEDEFNEFLKSGPYPEYPYIYDAVPPMDEWRPVFSKVELPNAEEIEV